MPKLLLFSDVHSDQQACRSLVNRASEVDLVIGAGDFCNMRRGLEAVIDTLSAIDTPTVLVPGNAESEEELRRACSDWPAAMVLHGDKATIAGIEVVGIGGGIPVTPFGDWSYDLTEDEARERLRDVTANGTTVDVLVSHSPPKGLVDRDSSGTSLGSMAIREAIDQLRPELVVCGHIHGSWEQEERVGDTTVINAGPVGLIRSVAS
ncbi:serine/threonine protein phosphatase [Longibacter salinarum]|uniref:Serine/threonine protein phosphatase n=1 Tax=Longibacter salinarum TaxID=1850348 RepID=A0A2A8D0E4_9BACT|nr:metallophosphoesterase family protein [Longibacter salinarum]PEN14331.1 serine/threonine protein phosphatase [Longibacter salinarum]